MLRSEAVLASKWVWRKKMVTVLKYHGAGFVRILLNQWWCVRISTTSELNYCIYCFAYCLNKKLCVANQHQQTQGWALAAPDGPWRLTFPPQQLEKLNLSCFHRNQQQCRPPWISQVQSGRTLTILVKTFGTLCVLGEENVIKVDPPPPLNSVGCYKSNTIYISCTLYGPQLCLGGVGENLVEAVFMSVYHRLAANFIQNQVKKGRCPNTFGPGL